MAAYIVVLDTPYYSTAVIDKDTQKATFYLKGVPDGGYTFDIWHKNLKLKGGPVKIEVKDGKTKKTEIGLKDGFYHGVVREWWENGNLQTETGFENGKRHGKNTNWDKDGKLIKEQVYDMDTVAEEKVYQ